MEKLEFNPLDERNTNVRKYYWFKCDCGNIVSKRSDSKSEYCNSADCSLSKFNRHGKHKTRLYRIWSGMRDRCLNINKSNIYYKDRGITIARE